METTALIVAGGEGLRFGGDIPKQYQLIAGRPLLSWTVSRFEAASTIDDIVIVCAEEYLLHVNNSVVNPYEFKKVSKIVPGGENRTESVSRGLKALPITTGYVAIHDAVRPMVTPSDIDLVVLEARNNRAAILGHPIADTLKRVREHMIIATVERANLFLAETPQVFQFDLIKEAYDKAAAEGRVSTDDASLLEAIGFMVKLIPSTGTNPKMTTTDDLEFIRYYFERESGERL